MKALLPIALLAVLAGCGTDDSLGARVRAMQSDPAALAAAILLQPDPPLTEVLEGFRP